jgi:hypothetical protein
VFVDVLPGCRCPGRGQNEGFDELSHAIGIDGLSAYDAQQTHCPNHVGD